MQWCRTGRLPGGGGYRASATAASMSPNTFYRLAIWLPLVTPGLVALLVHGAGYSVDVGRRPPGIRSADRTQVEIDSALADLFPVLNPFFD